MRPVCITLLDVIEIAIKEAVLQFELEKISTKFSFQTLSEQAFFRKSDVIAKRNTLKILILSPFVGENDILKRDSTASRFVVSPPSPQMCAVN